MFTNFKHSVVTAGTVSLLSFGSLAVASPSYAVSLDLSTWNRIGDVTTNPSQAILNTGGENTTTAPTGGGTNPLSLEDFLGLAPDKLINDLNPDAWQGSAIKNTLAVNAGDIFSFDWNFSSSDDDIAFVTINNNITALTGSSPFSYTFATAGNYNIGIGVVDVLDAFNSSTLTVSNANLQPVPEPTTILGSLTALGFGTGMLRRSRKKTSV
jgi:hypothetical protein